jgi:hypothetical protein
MKNVSVIFLLFIMGVLSGCSGISNPQTEMNDVDLTVLSSTMISAEIFQIMNDPEKYIGRKIKVNGAYAVYFYALTNRYYHYVMTQPGDVCCMEGFEIILSGGENYPEEQAWVEVTGIFASYRERGNTYYYLEVEEIK